MRNCDVLVIGAGPAGLYATYYAGFRGFDTILMDALPELGGQITAMYPEKSIFDVAGFPDVKGRDLVDGLVKQMKAHSPTVLLNEMATALSTQEDSVTVTTQSGEEINAKAIVICGGIGSFTPRALPTLANYESRGLVYFVPKLDVHKDKDVVIVGGGDSAFDWALSLAPIARSIKIVHRRDAFRAHATSVDAVKELGIELITESEVTGANGDEWLSGITVTHKDGSIRELPCQSVVAALGFVANIGPMSEWGIEVKKRHIVVDSAMQTNIPRIFAAGDITTYPGKVPLISVGFGEAATAVNNASPLIDPTHGTFPGHSSGGGE
jgi:thioredoxin reductase (NADPH)